MIVIVEDEIFASPLPGHLGLLRLFHLGFEGRHRIQTDPIYRSDQETALNLWLAQLPEGQREEVVFALETGLVEDATGILPDLEMRIGLVEDLDWDSDPLRLPLPAALNLLHKPLHILLESQTNDGAFLKSVAPLPWRKHYLRLLDAGWVQIDHGGGLPEMNARIKRTHRGDALRMYALFDSDARLPGEPSAQSEELRRSCGRSGISHHQLRRRSIESYLPVNALKAWAFSGPKYSRQSRRKAVESFSKMEALQRHHFNLKGGFEKDRQYGIPSFYGEHASDPWLRNGFGENIGGLFHEQDFPILEEWLVRDGQRQETTEILQSIFRRL